MSNREEILHKDSVSIWHPFTSFPSFGPREVICRAKGAYLYDQEERPYFDATSSWWSQIHGHCHPRLRNVLSQQAGQLDQMLFAPHTHEVAVDLSRALLNKLGKDFSRIFYSDDGSTAVEAALKIALQFWRNQKQDKRRFFVALDKAYHGDTLGAVMVSHVESFHHAFEGVMPPVFRSHAPYCFRCPEGRTYPRCQTACVDTVIQRIEKHGDEIAALILEPLVLGAAGMISYPREVVERLVAACQKQGVLVIFDEVFTGFGRTGTFFAMDQLGVSPDMVCLSKGLTSGMLPLGVTATTERVFDAFKGGVDKTFYHGHTFSANALGCAVALESLKIFDEENVIQKNQSLADFMQKESPAFRGLPHVGEVRQLGMIWAVELVQNKRTSSFPSPKNGPGWSIAQAAWEKGIWFRPLHNMLYVVPPYCATMHDLQAVFSVLYSELSNERHFSATA